MQEPAITVPAAPLSAPISRGARRGRFLSIALRPLYRLYEERLIAAVRTYPLPRHVGGILDGNRRHARKLGITDPREIYGIGARKLDDMLRWCGELRIPTVTLWVLSPENLRRSTAEVSGIFAAIEAKLTALARDPRIHQGRIRVRAIGKLSLVPEATLAAIHAAEAATAAHDGMVLNIAVAYGGRQEIVDAVAAFLNDNLTTNGGLAEAITRLTPEAVARYLYT